MHVARPRTVSPLLKLPADWRAWFAASDPALVSAGTSGELLVARVRLLLMLALLLVPVIALYGTHAGARRENLTAFVAVVVGLIVSVVVYRRASQDRPSPRLALGTSIFDVSLVSATQFAFLLQGFPSAAINSRTTFVAYFLAIGATCLRWDARVTLVAGVLAIAQYSVLVVLAQFRWPVVATLDVMVHGQLVVGHQLGRLIILVAFTLLCVAIVRQSLALRISSTHDALTGLMNRAFFTERLQDELARARRTEAPLCVALVDIDHFKRVNDEHGHAAGDAALEVVATMLRRSLRRSDLVARWGGEEFALAFPDTALPEAYGKVEQLRMELIANSILLSNGVQLRLTLSGGLSAAGADGSEARDLMSAADDRLLEAKRSGRNCVSTRAASRGPSGEWRVIAAS